MAPFGHASPRLARAKPCYGPHLPRVQGPYAAKERGGGKLPALSSGRSAAGGLPELSSGFSAADGLPAPSAGLSPPPVESLLEEDDDDFYEAFEIHTPDKLAAARGGDAHEGTPPATPSPVPPPVVAPSPSAAPSPYAAAPAEASVAPVLLRLQAALADLYLLSPDSLATDPAYVKAAQEAARQVSDFAARVASAQLAAKA